MMQLRQLATICLILAAVVTIPLRVCAVSASLETLRGQYTEARKKLVAGHDATAQSALKTYTDTLRAIREAMKTRGDLEGLLAADKEAARFNNAGTIPDEPDTSLPAGILNAQAGYRRSVSASSEKRDRGIVQLIKQYRECLQRLVKELVQGEDIELAKRVKGEIDNLDFELAELESKLPPAPDPAQPPVGSPSPKAPEKKLAGTVQATVKQIQSVGHALQLWRVLPPHAQAGRYRLSVQHAVPGNDGAFRLVAWTDKNDDGVPDQSIGSSKEFRGKESGDWSSWEFRTADGSFFVGNSWSRRGTQVFYSENRPEGYTGLGDEVFFSRSEDGEPTKRAGPRFINIRLEFLGK